MKIFFTSDPHYYHGNIINYCKRPFSTIEEMNEALITNWNKVVSKEDLVYIVGDFGFGSRKMLRKILERLNGTKILIIGNHDRPSSIPADCYEQIHNILMINGEGYEFTLVHDPATASADHSTDTKYICGHLHSLPENKLYKNWVDVGVDANGFTPVALEEIIKLFNNETKKESSFDVML